MSLQENQGASSTELILNTERPGLGKFRKHASSPLLSYCLNPLTYSQVSWSGFVIWHVVRFCDQVLRSDMWSCFVVSLNLEVSPESDVSAPLLDHAKLLLPTASLPFWGLSKGCAHWVKAWVLQRLWVFQQHLGRGYKCAQGSGISWEIYPPVNLDGQAPSWPVSLTEFWLCSRLEVHVNVKMISCWFSYSSFFLKNLFKKVFSRNGWLNWTIMLIAPFTLKCFNYFFLWKVLICQVCTLVFGHAITLPTWAFETTCTYSKPCGLKSQGTFMRVSMRPAWVSPRAAYI